MPQQSGRYGGLLIIPAPIGVVGFPPALPLAVSGDGRYLVLPNGTPFRMHGDSGWEIFNELTFADTRQYFKDRAGRGINTVRVQLTNAVRFISSSIAPAARGAGSVLPFDNKNGSTWDGDPAHRDSLIGGSGTPNYDADFSRPVTAYWDWVETVIREARSWGIVLVADIMYWGFNQGAEGWWQTISASQNTQTVHYNFGLYLGARLRAHPNLVLVMGTDMFPTSASEASARMGKLMDGLSDAGCTHLVSAHYFGSSDADDYSDYTSRVTLRGVYPGYGSGHPAYGRARIAYAKGTVKPVVVFETGYEGEHSQTRAHVRGLFWWCSLSSIGGYIMGNFPVWGFDTGWQAQLNSNGAQDFKLVNDFLKIMPWYQLVPHGLGSIGTLVTAGGGTAQTTAGTPGNPDTANGLDYVAAAATPSGSHLVAYVPDAHSGSVTIDMTKLSGTCVADWYDPTNGASTAIGSIANTGTHAFTIPGTNSIGDSDWVLRLVV